MGDIERWTMYRRRDWPQVMPWVLPADAPKPEPDEQLEAFEVVRATDYQGAVSQIGELQDALADALSGDGRRIDSARNVLAIYEAADAATGGQ